jgi:LmbE family N-acetylglucosaminyl deacetylase
MSKKAGKYLLVVAVILFSLLLLFFVGKVVKMRAFSYNYNQQLDYNYDFNPASTEMTELQLCNNQIDLSNLSTGVNTAFVEIGISLTLNGFVSEPEVKMMANGDTLSQSFECRAKGIRYLNISGLVQKGAKEIRLEFSGCKPKSKAVRLIAFKNPDLSKEKILILAPHPDDAEIAAYGLYASNPANTFIATITAGDAGSMRYDELYSDSTAHYIEKGKIRAWNSTTVPLLGGIASENCINLGYFDASLKKMHNDTAALAKSRYLNTTDINLFRSKNCSHLPDSLKAESSWRSLVNDLKYLLLKVHPTVVLSTYPAIDWHFDHKFTTVALVQAMNELHYDTCQLWLYTNHLPLNDFYPFGKQGSAIGLPPHFNREPIYFDRLCSFPLSKSLQSEKVLALDAMNDLRPDTQYRNTKTSWMQTKKNFWDKLYLKESDYFRRSVRSNELFFVIDEKNALQPEIQTKLFEQL